MERLYLEQEKILKHFATLFDFNYLSRGLCLNNSLREYLKDDYLLFVLCLDNQTYQYFQQQPAFGVFPVKTEDIEAFFPELSQAKTNRSIIEYYFTLSPYWPLYLLKNYPQCERITTLDSDIYFFDSPEKIFDRYPKDAIIISPHDFSSTLKGLTKFGVYNVSFQSFPNNDNGLAVLNDWRTKCFNWCEDRYDEETGFFADQKYLDSWEQNFMNIHPLADKRCCRAPWNIAETPLKYKNGTILVGDERLIFYHFHALRISPPIVKHNFLFYDVKNTFAIKKLYEKYIKAILKSNKMVQNHNDLSMNRHPFKKSSNALRSMWKIGSGALLCFRKIYFFDLTFLKSDEELCKLKNGKIN